MKLCKHIQPIYEAEIKTGNTVASVTTPQNTPCHLCVHMNNTLRNNYADSALLPEIDKTPTYPVTILYFCRECGCRIDGPIGNKPGYTPDYNWSDPRVLATPKNVYVQDDYYEQGMKPTFISEEEKKNADHYWTQHPDQKQQLETQLTECIDLLTKATHQKVDIKFKAHKEITEIKKQIQELELRHHTFRINSPKEAELMQKERIVLTNELSNQKSKTQESFDNIQNEITKIEKEIRSICEKMCRLKN
jgi:hypothetical protein